MNLLVFDLSADGTERRFAYGRNAQPSAQNAPAISRRSTTRWSSSRLANGSAGGVRSCTRRPHRCGARTR